MDDRHVIIFVCSAAIFVICLAWLNIEDRLALRSMTPKERALSDQKVSDDLNTW